jgi:hypothetical protein
MYVLFVCVCMYVCMYIYIYMCVCVCVCIIMTGSISNRSDDLVYDPLNKNK